MAEMDRLESQLLDKVSDDAFPMTTSQLAAMAEELEVDQSLSNFFERIPERSFSSRDEIRSEVSRVSGEGEAPLGEGLAYEEDRGSDSLI